MPTRMIITMFVVLSPLTAYAQETAWKRYIDAGQKATWQDRDEAEKPLLRALKEAENFGEQDPRLAKSLQALATLYRLEDKHQEAVLLLQRAVAITEKGLGPEHHTLAAYLNDLAFTNTHQDKYAEAEPLYLRALTIWEKAGRPEEDIHLAISLHNYAVLLQKMDRNAEAEKLEERSKAIWDNQQWGRTTARSLSC
ncbi:MAG: tetratricopeptide repeat protein [Acidobacteria bacterium]|nr:tetratricopeptide repeat protein [Acidobacteriota bacterium]